ncbi:MAG: hypothetical protein ISR65_17095 [Bacteriovoracaceae bacterium]|nr:hypothetical protein [Bacteriovoracaceae bacterium]
MECPNCKNGKLIYTLLWLGKTDVCSNCKHQINLKRSSIFTFLVSLPFYIGYDYLFNGINLFNSSFRPIPFSLLIVSILLANYILDRFLGQFLIRKPE